MITKEQKIIDLVSDKLPIKVFPERAVLGKLRESFPNIEVKLDTIFEIHRMIDGGNEGGILCDICPLDFDIKNAQTAFLCSITHLRVKVGEPHFTELEKYRKDRTKKLQKQNNPFSFFRR